MIRHPNDDEIRCHVVVHAHLAHTQRPGHTSHLNNIDSQHMGHHFKQFAA